MSDQMRLAAVTSDPSVLHLSEGGSFPSGDPTFREARLRPEEALEMQMFTEHLLRSCMVDVMEAFTLVRSGRNIQLTTKPDGTPVSKIDVDTQAKIFRMIATRYPSHALLGEEGGDSDLYRPLAKFCWVIDPIDGTKNLLGKSDRFGISIGLFHEGLPVVAGIWSPALMEGDDLWSGTITCSCNREYIYQGNQKFAQHPQSRDFLGYVSGDTPFADTYRELITAEPPQGFDTVEVKKSGGSAIAVAGDILRNVAHLYSTIERTPPKTYIWDIAAVGYILRKAGFMHLVRTNETADDLHFTPATDWISALLTDPTVDPRKTELTMLMLHPKAGQQMLGLVRGAHRHLKNN